MLFLARGDRVVDLAMLRLRGVLGPEYCVMNVLGMLVPEVLIFYLFFFIFSGWLWDRFAKWRPWIIALAAITNYPSFFGPLYLAHSSPPPTTVQPQWVQP